MTKCCGLGNSTRFGFLLLLLCTSSVLTAQVFFSFGTDLGIQRNFRKEQQYTAFGHNLQGHFHFNRKDEWYASLSYYTNGNFSNTVTAVARQPATIPQEIKFVSNSFMRFKQVSTGYKRYLKGGFDIEEGWSLYGSAGFGLVLGRIENFFNVGIDTTDYTVPLRSGKANFKRLTIDLALGYEIPLGGDVYFYTEARSWIPASAYPSKYLFVNKNAPLIGILNAGIRINFN